MATLHISVPETMRDWVQSQVDDGKYMSADDYVRELISRDQGSTDKGYERWLADLNRGIAAGLADVAAGRVVDADEMFDRLEAKYAALPQK